MSEVNLNDLIKALRCLASNDPGGDCHEDYYNLGTSGQRISCYGSPDTIKCPYNQGTYGVCFEDGDCAEWLGEAAELLEELQQYRQIGTVKECRGYKKHSKEISRLNNCNDCGRSIRCQIAPRPGEYCRINCAWWRAQGWEPMPEDNSAYWKQEAQRQAAAAGELKIALAEKLDELTKRIADREETLRGIEDNLQYVSVEWQIKQLKAIKDWLEGLIDGKENEPVSNPDKLDDGWIPVEERLPEVQQDVLVSLRSLEVYSGFRSNIDGYFNVNSGELVSNENVLAWQPLPAPYRPKEATR